MASTCISSYTIDARVPVRATYVNLYKWPESDAEFVKSLNSNVGKNGSNLMFGHPSVVESFSCRQLYLRSYTFSKEEDYNKDDKITVKCLGRAAAAKWKVMDGLTKRKSDAGNDGFRRKFTALKRAKVVSRSALVFVFGRLLSCTTKIDVVS